MIEYYKHRSIDPSKPIWVYRNLMRSDGPWYSIMQNGLVVAHAKEVVLTSCRFVIREANRQKAIETNVRNVHAFVVGYWCTRKGHKLTRRGMYNFRTCKSFVDCTNGDGAGNIMQQASVVRLDWSGLKFER